ncbi:MAG: DivIVA domain-containing protein [Pelovirga sp.]
MRITPIEIQQQRFKNRLFGYDSTAVDQYLEMLADEVERLNRQNNELKESLARTRTSLEQMREREKLLQQTLVTAQKMSDELKEQAHREAEIIIAEAHLEAERMLGDANQRRIQLVKEIQEIKGIGLSFRSGLRTLIETHGQLLDLEPETLHIDRDRRSAALQSLLADQKSESGPGD